MAHFTGGVRGGSGEATRLGTAKTGMVAWAASWAGKVKITLYVDANGIDRCQVTQETHHNAGISEVVADFAVGKPASE